MLLVVINLKRALALHLLKLRLCWKNCRNLIATFKSFNLHLRKQVQTRLIEKKCLLKFPLCNLKNTPFLCQYIISSLNKFIQFQPGLLRYVCKLGGTAFPIWDIIYTKTWFSNNLISHVLFLVNKNLSEQYSKSSATCVT